MLSPIGNEFWEARSSHSRSRIFIDPAKLLTACTEYFEWVETHPLYEAKPFAYQGDVTIKEVTKNHLGSVHLPGHRPNDMGEYAGSCAMRGDIFSPEEVRSSVVSSMFASRPIAQR